MQVIVDPKGRTVTLVDPDDTKRFDVLVRASGPNDTVLLVVDQVLQSARVGRVDRPADAEPRATIDPAAVRRLAEPTVAPGWDDEFQAMLAFAATKGWIDPDDGGVRAHLSWSELS